MADVVDAAEIAQPIIELTNEVERLRGKVEHEMRYIGPNVGSVWEWEPLKPHARQRVRVTDVRWNGEELWIESEGKSGRHWNELSRWVEATVLVTPAESDL